MKIFFDRKILFCIINFSSSEKGGKFMTRILYILLLVMNYIVILLGAVFASMWYDNIASLVPFLMAIYIAKKNITFAVDILLIKDL